MGFFQPLRYLENPILHMHPLSRVNIKSGPCFFPKPQMGPERDIKDTGPRYGSSSKRFLRFMSLKPRNAERVEICNDFMGYG
jgi:hypothetical protein